MSVSSGPPAIAARGLRRIYNVKPTPVVALDGVDLEVAPGEFFGLLGPNGAGKTTLIKILTTLLLPSAGTAQIFGFDVVNDVKRIRRIMNMVAGGEQSGYGILNVREQLWMFSQFYGLTRAEGWKRVDELVEAVGMGPERLQRVSTLSTGQRQKMNFARGLLNDPWILFLDEPTLGLDVAAARCRPRAGHVLEGRRARADRSCSRPTTWPRPTTCASASPSWTTAGSWPSARRTSSRSGSSANRSSGSSWTTSTAARRPSPRCPASCRPRPPSDDDGPVDRQSVVLNLVLAEDGVLGGVVVALSAMGSHILALRKSEPSLEDVFVELVGRGFADEDQQPVAGRGRAMSVYE